MAEFRPVPMAEVTSLGKGAHEVFFHDLRYGHSGTFWLNPTVTVDLDKLNHVERVHWQFGVPG